MRNVDGTDIVLFNKGVLVCFYPRRDIRFYDCGMPVAYPGFNLVIGKRSDNVNNINCLDMMLLQVQYFFGYLEVLIAACLSPMKRDLHIVLSV